MFDMERVEKENDLYRKARQGWTNRNAAIEWSQQTNEHQELKIRVFHETPLAEKTSSRSFRGFPKRII